MNLIVKDRGVQPFLYCVLAVCTVSLDQGANFPFVVKWYDFCKSNCSNADKPRGSVMKLFILYVRGELEKIINSTIEEP